MQKRTGAFHLAVIWFLGLGKEFIPMFSKIASGFGVVTEKPATMLERIFKLVGFPAAQTVLDWVDKLPEKVMITATGGTPAEQLVKISSLPSQLFVERWGIILRTARSGSFRLLDVDVLSTAVMAILQMIVQLRLPMGIKKARLETRSNAWQFWGSIHCIKNMGQRRGWTNPCLCSRVYWSICCSFRGVDGTATRKTTRSNVVTQMKCLMHVPTNGPVASWCSWH